MIKFKTLSILVFTFFVGAIQAQERQLDKNNMREGEEVEYCFTVKKMEELKANGHKIPEPKKLNIERGSSRGIVYKIPVVFHVLHTNGTENISNQQILDAVTILNRDYRKENADASLTHFNFNATNPDAFAIPTDAEIEFVLATKAPDGTCFGGITRTYTALSNQGEDGIDQLEAVKNGNDVYQGEWNSNKYLNFIVCADIGGAAGYAYYPGSWSLGSMNSSIWILNTYVGSIGTASVTSSRALTHEVGHWLGLPHTWGDSNGPADPENCNMDDYVDDTPNCQGSTSCNLTRNSCFDLGIWGVDAPDNIENFMEYSYCSKMYTQGQVDQMRYQLNQSYDGRNNLWSASNLEFTGTNGTTPLCYVNFEANKTDICLGGSIQFTDLSNAQSPTWNWSFPEGTPATSSSQNPTVTYNTSGLHPVTLTLSNASGTVTETKTAYIRVSNTAANLPILEDFEGYTSSSELPFTIQSTNNSVKWELTNTAGQTGTKSIKLHNYIKSGTNSDAFISEAIDLSTVTAQTGVTLSFRYAYRKKNQNNSELLQLSISNDCGENFVTRKTLSGTILSSDATNTDWTPTQADWKTVHVTNITTSYWVSNFKYRFNFEGSGGNNIFIDNINIYKGEPTDMVGIEEVENVLSEINIYPNPAESELNVSFETSQSKTLAISILDLTGKVIQKQEIYAPAGGNEVTLSTTSLAPGMYFVRLGSDATANTLRFVVK